MITAEQHEKLRGWFAGRLPDDLFESLGEVTVDREEITVIGRIPEPRLAENASDAERKAADLATVSARALMFEKLALGSFDQDGTRPHRIIEAASRMTGTSWLGATLNRPASGNSGKATPKCSSNTSRGLAIV